MARRQPWAVLAGAAFVAVVAAVVVGGAVRSLRESATRTTAGATSAAGTLPGLQTGPAPWPPEIENLRARLGALGLPALAAEGQVLHTHQHLDVFVHGKSVVVPAGIGIDDVEQFISPLHTHDDSGIVHVESPTVRTFTLGQLFAVWGVRFTPRCLGGYCAKDAQRLRVFVDGRPVGGDPRRLVLADRQEIVVAFGTRAELPRPLPRSYEDATSGGRAPARSGA